MTSDELLNTAKQAQWHITHNRERIAEHEKDRKAAIDGLLNDGWSTRKLAAELGLSAARINQIHNARKGVQ